MSCSKVPYLGFANCLRLANDDYEIVASTDVGPRILRYARIGGDNVLGEVPNDKVATALGDWKPWGGHRLWAAPENMPATYAPDDVPLERVDGDTRTIELVERIHPATRLRKRMRVSLDAATSEVTIDHRITNHADADVAIASWGLTILRGGGEALLPQEPFGPHPEYLLPARPMAVWQFTDMSDPRFTFGRRLSRIRTDASRASPQKIGIGNKQGWAAYHVGDELFVKRFEYDADATYPDYGCNAEVFTAGPFIEVESLSALRRVPPGESVEHRERWSLVASVDPIVASDDVAALEASARA